MIALASGLSYIDLLFQARPRAIATVVVHGPGGDGAHRSRAVEHAAARTRRAGADRNRHRRCHGAAPDAHSSRPRRRERDAGPRGILGCGSTYAEGRRAHGRSREAPGERSRRRLYGRRDGPLCGATYWPRAGFSYRRRWRAANGSRHPARSLDVACTPGHASHHVSYFEPRRQHRIRRRIPPGIRVIPGGVVLPPTPPPDVDPRGVGRQPPPHRGLGPGDAVRHALRTFVAGRATPARTRRSSSGAGHGASSPNRAGAGRGTDESRERWFIEDVRRIAAAAQYEPTPTRRPTKWRDGSI